MEVNKNSSNNPMMFGGNCPYLLMEICPMIPSMCPGFSNQMINSPYPMNNQMMDNEMMNNEMMGNPYADKGTYLKVKSVPISQLIE